MFSFIYGFLSSFRGLIVIMGISPKLTIMFRRDTPQFHLREAVLIRFLFMVRFVDPSFLPVCSFSHF